MNLYKIVNSAVLIFICQFYIFANCDFEIHYSRQGNSLNYDCNYEQSELRFEIYIDSITGSSGVYAIHPFGEGIVSKTLVTPGIGFAYTFSENDKLSQAIGFSVYDGQVDSCFMESYISYNLTFLDFTWCLDTPACSNKIFAEFKQNELGSIFSCNETKDGLSVELDTMYGGTADLTINTLGLGSLSYGTQNEVFYNFNQNDINTLSSEIGIEIDDNNGCVSTYDFSGEVAFTDIEMFCTIVSNNESLENVEAVYTIFPMPVCNTMHVRIEREGLLNIREINILDMAGEILTVKEGNFNIINTFNLERLTTGIYLLEIKTLNEVYYDKLIKI